MGETVNASETMVDSVVALTTVGRYVVQVLNLLGQSCWRQSGLKRVTLWLYLLLHGESSERNGLLHRLRSAPEELPCCWWLEEDGHRNQTRL